MKCKKSFQHINVMDFERVTHTMQAACCSFVA